MPISSFSSANSIMKPGVCTSTTRPASPYDGQVVYETDTDRVAVYDSSAWVYKTNAGAPALTLVKSQTIGSAVSSVTVSDVFSATYDNYMVTINGGVASTGVALYMQLGATTTGYYEGRPGIALSGGTFVGNTTSNGSQFLVGSGNTGNLKAMTQLHSPFLAKPTSHFSGLYGSSTTQADISMGVLDNTTSYTAFTILTSSGTMTGGTIRVYGYSN